MTSSNIVESELQDMAFQAAHAINTGYTTSDEDDDELQPPPSTAVAPTSSNLEEEPQEPPCAKVDTSATDLTFESVKGGSSISNPSHTSSGNSITYSFDDIELPKDFCNQNNGSEPPNQTNIQLGVQLDPSFLQTCLKDTCANTNDTSNDTDDKNTKNVTNSATATNPPKKSNQALDITKSNTFFLKEKRISKCWSVIWSLSSILTCFSSSMSLMWHIDYNQTFVDFQIDQHRELMNFYREREAILVNTIHDSLSFYKDFVCKPTEDNQTLSEENFFSATLNKNPNTPRLQEEMSEILAEKNDAEFLKEQREPSLVHRENRIDSHIKKQESRSIDFNSWWKEVLS